MVPRASAHHLNPRSITPINQDTDCKILSLYHYHHLYQMSLDSLASPERNEPRDQTVIFSLSEPSNPAVDRITLVLHRPRKETGS
jgi:hypothetical protein